MIETQLKSSVNYKIKQNDLNPNDKGLGIEPIPEVDENEFKKKE